MGDGATRGGGETSLSEIFLRYGNSFATIGHGDLGGKARGLVFFTDMLKAELDARKFPQFDVGVPPFAVITTDLFDAFMEQNDLAPIALSDRPDDEIARAFQHAELPDEVMDALGRLAAEVPFPLAVRSSSLLEDAIYRPFAGVYQTKMVPNNHADPDERLGILANSVRLVYASTYFRAARGYLRASRKTPGDEKMAVIIQEVIGSRRGERFYPTVSGVGRSYNFYPAGGARPEDGVVHLALGLGKTIVEGGACWVYSPARPKAPPPYGAVGELLKNSQLDFWCVNMGRPDRDDPTSETEYLSRADLAAAEADRALVHVSSTYDPCRDRLVPGIGAQGPRVVDFAPLLVLDTLPVNPLVQCLLAISERAAGSDVEIEFALTLPEDRTSRARLGFLQVRPMVVSHEEVAIGTDELARSDVLLGSTRVMGNGSVEDIRDIVYVKPDAFDARFTRAIAGEVEKLNAALLGDRRPYLLIGFGRWGSADPWLGIPVDWAQICGAKVIVEAPSRSMNVEPSQGSHFFHNISSFRVSYLTVDRRSRPGIDWDWLGAQPAFGDTRFLRHVRLERPLRVKVDGRSGRGAVWRPEH